MPISSNTQFVLDSNLLEPDPDYPMAASEIAAQLAKLTERPAGGVDREVLLRGTEDRLNAAITMMRHFRTDDKATQLGTARDAVLGAFLLLDRLQQDTTGLR